MREVVLTIDDFASRVTPRTLGWILTGVAVLLALLIGLATSAEWQTLLLYQDQASTAFEGRGGRDRPSGRQRGGGVGARSIFGKPVSFYLFDHCPSIGPSRSSSAASSTALITVLTSVALALVFARRQLSPTRRGHVGVAPRHPRRAARGHRGGRLPARQVRPGAPAADLPAADEGVNATDHAVPSRLRTS
ncbi:MAG: hypothetical protein U0869_17155 [Chloroflexota bacterium]